MVLKSPRTPPKKCTHDQLLAEKLNISLCNKLVVKLLTPCHIDYCFHFYQCVKFDHVFSVFGRISVSGELKLFSRILTAAKWLNDTYVITCFEKCCKIWLRKTSFFFNTGTFNCYFPAYHSQQHTLQKRCAVWTSDCTHRFWNVFRSIWPITHLRFLVW